MAAALVQTPTQPTFNIEEFLAAEESKGLLRLTTAGSVDDGKSTLMAVCCTTPKALTKTS